MKLILRARDKRYDARGTYDETTKLFIVKKGSIVSGSVSASKKFRGREAVIQLRKQYIRDGIVSKDVTFKSASTAANFVTGTSTNGMIAWKDEKGTKFGELINREA